MKRKSESGGSSQGRKAELGLHVVGAKRRRKVKAERPANGFRGCVRSRLFELSFKARS
jgi:hypothetical protein